MKERNDISLQDLDIITAISKSEKTEVYLVSAEKVLEDSIRVAILKKYKRKISMEHYLRIGELSSAYFPRLYGIWEEGDACYLLEEYIAGKTLQEKLEEEALLREGQLTYYMTELCKALQVLHQMKPPVIHRDLKPENVIITGDGAVKLLDLDASREYKEKKERDTVFLGTREYASPEQFGFMQTDIRSDIYSWGIVYAELLDHGATGLLALVLLIQSFGEPAGVASGRMVVLQVELPVMEEVSAEAVSRPEEVPAEAIADTEETYHYVSLEEDMLMKSNYISVKYSYLYNTKGFDENDDGIYAEGQETVLGREYEVLRFLKAYPRDVVVNDDRFHGMRLESISYCRYLEESGTNGSWIYLEESDYVRSYDNVIAVTADFLQTLKPGAYTFHIKLGNDGADLTFGYYLIVHGEEEKVDNFCVHILNEIGYYSSAKRNDVIFYINNTPFPVKEISIGSLPLAESEYDLVADGFGVVLHPKLLEKYKDLQSVDLEITMENDKQTCFRVINLDVF